MSNLIGAPAPQWLVDICKLSKFAWSQARPPCVFLANLRPETLPVLITATVRILEVLVVISIGAARWSLLQAIDDRLRNGRLICRQVRGEVGIRHVEEYEIYQIDPGRYGWCVNFIGY